MTAGRPRDPRPGDDAVVIGIDIGTTNSKAVACLADGSVVATARLEHDVSSPQTGWFEHDAEAVWWGDTVALCRQLLREIGSAHRVRGLAVTTCGPCLVPVDAALRPLRPGILYGVDTRATAEAAALEARFGRRALAALSRMPLTSQAVGPKIAWVAAHEPAVFRQAVTWHTATSFIVARLTGEAAIDHHQASFFAPFIDARRRAWDLRYADGLELDGRLPRLAWPGEVAGSVQALAATATGLPEGTPVLVGTSDGPTAALAVGASLPGIVAIAHGTTTALTTFAAPARRTTGLWATEGWAPERRCIGGGLSSTGAIVSWFRRELARDLPDGDAAAQASAHATLSAEAAASPPGAKGLVVLPYFSGERTPFADPSARGVVAGLTLAHTRGDLHRGILEGIAFGVRHLLDTMTAAGVPIDRLRASGGGTLSPVGLQIVSDVSGREQEVPRQTSGAAFGAARLAAATLGWTTDDGGEDGWFRLDRVVRPDPATAALYDRRYEAFRQLYRDTRPVVHRLVAGNAAEADATLAAPLSAAAAAGTTRS